MIPVFSYFAYLLDLQVRRVFHQNETDFYLNETEGNMIKIPAENFEVKGKHVVFERFRLVALLI